MSTESQECFVCKAQFTDLDLFWKHIYEVECEPQGPTEAASHISVSTGPTSVISNGAVTTATITTTSDEDKQKDTEMLPPPTNSGPWDIYPNLLAQIDSSKAEKTRKRKQVTSTTKSLPEHSRESSGVRANGDSSERRPVLPDFHSSSSLRSLTRLSTTFKRNKSTILYCDVCQVTLSSYASLEQHEKGRRHLKALSKGCGNDSLSTSSMSDDKTKGNTTTTRPNTSHSAKAVSKSPGSSNQTPFVAKLTVDTENRGIWCTDCNLLLPSEKEFQVHRDSFRHRSAVAWKQRGASSESPSSNPEDVYGYQKPDSSASLKPKLIPSAVSVSNEEIPNPNSDTTSPKVIDTKNIIRKLCLTQLLSLISDSDACDETSLDAQVIRETFSKCRDELVHLLSLDSKASETSHLKLANKNIDSTVSKYTSKIHSESTELDKLLHSITLLSWCRQLQLLD